MGAKKNIEASDVREHGFPDEEGDTKNLEEALWTRNMGEAMHQARMLSEIGVRGEAIFPICERVFRTLILTQNYLTEKKMNWEAVYAAFHMRGKTQQSNLMRGVKAYKPAELRSSLEKILQADYDLKTGRLPSEMAVSILMLNLCGAPAPVLLR